MIGEMFRPASQRAAAPPHFPSTAPSRHEQPSQIGQDVSGLAGGMPVPMVRATALGAGQTPPNFPALRSHLPGILKQPSNMQLAMALFGGNSTSTP